MTEALCNTADMRLLGNIAFLASKMGWQEETEAIYGALAPMVQSKAEVYFAWLAARCELGDLEGACKLMARLEALKDAPAGMALIARCFLQCCSDAPEWVENARRVVYAGPEAFGYETARAMLEEHDLRRIR